MKIIVNTSTFKQSSNDPAPNFINKLVEEFSEKNNFYILFPRKTKDVISKVIQKIYPYCPTVIFFQKVYQTYQNMACTLQ